MSEFYTKCGGSTFCIKNVRNVKGENTLICFYKGRIHNNRKC